MVAQYDIGGEYASRLHKSQKILKQLKSKGTKALKGLKKSRKSGFYKALEENWGGKLPKTL